MKIDCIITSFQEKMRPPNWSEIPAKEIRKMHLTQGRWEKKLAGKEPQPLINDKSVHPKQSAPPPVPPTLLHSLRKIMSL